MKSTAKKILSIGVVVLCAVSTLFAAPKKKASKEDKAAAKQLEEQFVKKLGYQIKKDPKTKKAYDFGGEKLIIGDWFSPEKGQLTRESRSPKEEDTNKFRKFVNSTYNMDVDLHGIGGWGTHPQTVANFCITGGDEKRMYVIDGRSIASGLKAKLFWDLTKLDVDIDWSNPKWVAGVKEKMTKGDAIYGCTATDCPEPKTGLFFNKRLLREANIDPDSIYDMQKNGTWTWTTFEEVLKKTTRDIDNDGVIDIWGMANVSNTFTPMAVMSNGSAYIGKDKDGNFYSMLGDERTIEAMTWTANMVMNYEMPYPAGANWDWMYAAFQNGETVFCAQARYYGDQIMDMEDDWGFVCFPLGPKSDGKYRSTQDENTYVIPGCYTKAEATKIFQMYDLWSDLTPGYDADAWKDDFYPRFKDSRAVDETLQYMKDNSLTDYSNLISGLDWGWLPNVYGGFVTPQEAYESAKNSWDAMIREQNR